MFTDTSLDLLLILFLYGMALFVVWRVWPQSMVGLYGLGLYALSGFCAFVYYNAFGGNLFYRDLPFLPLLYAWSMILVLLWPLFRFQDKSIQGTAALDERRLQFFLWVLAILVLGVHLSVLPKTLAGVAESWRGNALELYNLRRSDNLLKTSLSFSPQSACFMLARAFAEIVVFFFFYAMASKKYGRWLTAVLGVCSVFPALDTLSTAGRNGLITLGMNVVFLLILFWRLLSVKAKRIMMLVGTVVLGGIVLAIVTITVSRFGMRGSYDAWESVFRYAGQPLLNFAYYMPTVKVASYGDSTLPAVRWLLGLSPFMSMDKYREIWGNALGVPLNVFYTAVGDLILDFGWVGTAVLCVLCSRFATRNARVDKGLVSLHALFLMYAVFLIVGHGMFYFMYKTFSGNLRIFACAATYMGLRWLSRKGGNAQGPCIQRG